MSFAESGGYADAVGDLSLIDAKWGPSIGLFQVRSLRDPNGYAVVDRWRNAEQLRDPWYNAQAAYAISRQGSDWSPWSVYKSGTYREHVGRDYEIRTGHERADRWNA